MASKNAEGVARYRERHPGRARLQGRINEAYAASARLLAKRHPAEFEDILTQILRERGLPRGLPPLARIADQRRNGKVES